MGPFGGGDGRAGAGRADVNAEEARQFVAGKYFAFTCFDGSRGGGRIMSDGGRRRRDPVRWLRSGAHIRLPGNTLQVRGQAVCASIKGIPFEPCFNLDKKDERNFRGSVSGMGFAYCDFHKGAAQMMMARAVARPRSLRPPAQTAWNDADRGDGAGRNPAGRERQNEPVKSEAKSEPAKSESTSSCAARPIRAFSSKARPGLDRDGYRFA